GSAREARMSRIALLVGCLIGGPADPADEVVRETKRFDGTWRMVSEEVEGVPTPKGELQPDLQIVAKGGYALIRRPGKEPHSTMRADPAARPRTFDVVYLEDLTPGSGTRGRWS